MLENRDMPEIPGVLQPDNIAFELKQTIAQILGLKKVDYFPGSQPTSFERRHIEERLLKHDYYVCEKSDGLRCLLLILADRFPDGSYEEGVFLITRSYEFYRILNIHFPISKENLKQPHNGTLVDGELVLDKRQDNGMKELRYLAFDLLSVNMTSYTARPADKRLAHIQDLIDPYYYYRSKFPEETSTFPFKVSFKKMSTCFKIPKVLSSLPYLPHVSDGLIFTCCETPYVFGTDHSLLKWKPAEENTIDFKIELKFNLFKDEENNDQYYDYDSKPKIELSVWKGGNAYEYFNDLTLTDKEWEEMKSLSEPLNFRIAEVKRNEQGQWNLLRFRDDKANGNHYTVVKKVLHSINDGVTKQELIEASHRIERNWIKRGAERKLMAKERQRGSIHKLPHLQSQPQSQQPPHHQSHNLASAAAHPSKHQFKQQQQQQQSQHGETLQHNFDSGDLEEVINARKRAAAEIMPSYEDDDEDDDEDDEDGDYNNQDEGDGDVSRDDGHTGPSIDGGHDRDDEELDSEGGEGSSKRQKR